MRLVDANIFLRFLTRDDEGISEIYSYDTDFDVIPGVCRSEP